MRRQAALDYKPPNIPQSLSSQPPLTHIPHRPVSKFSHYLGICIDTTALVTSISNCLPGFSMRGRNSTLILCGYDIDIHIAITYHFIISITEIHIVIICCHMSMCTHPLSAFDIQLPLLKYGFSNCLQETPLEQ